MFFRKSSSQLPAVNPEPTDTPRVEDSDRALDSIAELVRTYGKYSIETAAQTASEVSEKCDAWASRIVLGATRADEANGGAGAGRRDFGGLMRFFEETRREESEFVNQSQTSLRSALQQFAACLGYALAADRKADGGLEEQLETLASALDTNDPQRIKLNADRVLRAARLTLLERRQREAKQVEILAEKFNQLKTELLEARTQATTDALTLLYNRNALDQHLERIADWGVLFQHAPCLLLLDVDHFKEINDQYGHPVGDAVLRSIADVLTRSFLRRQDFVARYGGEEFAVVVVETSETTLTTMASRLLESIRKMDFQHAGTPIEITISLGLASLTSGERPASWLERADRALYQAKKRGRDRMIRAA